MSKVIVFQGDSITDAGRSKEAGLPPNKDLGFGYPYLTAAALLAGEPEKAWQIYNRGISGNRVVKAFAREEYEKDRFRERNQAFMDSHLRINKLWLTFGAVNYLPAFGCLAIYFEPQRSRAVFSAGYGCKANNIGDFGSCIAGFLLTFDLVVTAYPYINAVQSIRI